ncbi:alpha/beta fold hydrolase [Monashia sp. NPDC004114]
MGTPERVDRFHRDGLEFDVSDEGPLDGEVVVLLHGFPTDRTCWGRVTAVLNGAGLRTLAPDQRGYSPAARPAGRTAYRLEELVADVVALVDATGASRVHLVGHDWGGAIAWLVAGNHPDRVATVTAVSTPHPAALARAWRTGTDQRLRSWYIAALQVPRLSEWALAARFERALARTGLPPEDTTRYAARLAHRDALTGPASWYRAVRSSHIRAHRIRVPAALVWGRSDPFLGRRAAELTREHVTADYFFVELDAGHWLPETRADDVASVILQRVGQGLSGSDDARNTPDPR